MRKRNYKQEYLALRKNAHKKGIKVRENWHNDIWRGMNPKAGRSLNVRCPKKTVLLSTSEDTYKEKAETTRHELVELKLMNKGLKYRKAHKIAMRKEDDRILII